MTDLPHRNKYKSFKEYAKHDIPPIAELIKTEETYIETLENVVYGYMAEFFKENSEIPAPDDLKDHDCQLIFGNIKEIYEWHKRHFSEELKKNQHCVRSLSNVFIENEHQFHMYAKYINNKPISEYIIKNNIQYFDKVKTLLNHKLTIESYMIEPMQRVVRYKILLTEILKHLKKNKMEEDLDSLHEALTVIEKSCNEADEFMILNGIQNFDGIISDQGKLLHRGYLLCNYDGKKRKSYVFLFKRLILFTKKPETKGNRRYSIDTYNTCLQIPMNKLELKELTNSKFFLQLMDPNVPNCKVICEGETKEEYKEWLQAIKKQLSLQKNLIHDLVHPTAEDEDEREVL
ncbi:rho guanine nucleotide exchange factor 25-like [Lucilia cuprina]|uniref:rho guanine nucleotide exchange factor 25-like n=1 Tax=Lucilia cuprina TaxID=7375 RepID=UPI001F052EB5|nr:rho guanine nucleotide exchange factor 25-like [Lucilia cuprina]